METRFAEGRQERSPGLVAEVIRLKVDVLVIGSTVGALAAKKATTTVPIVFAGVSEPQTHGIVTSLARPGGNITGVGVGIGEVGFGGKLVELLKEAAPGISHVVVFSNSADPQSARSVGDIQVAARKLKVKVDVLDAGNDATLDKALANIGVSGAQGIIVTKASFLTANTPSLFNSPQASACPPSIISSYSPMPGA